MLELQDAMTGPASEVFDLATATRLNEEPVIPELVAPLVNDMRRQVEELVGWHDVPVTARAVDDMLDGYARMVARLTNVVVVQRFTSFRLLRDPLWRPASLPPGDAPQGAKRAILDAYIAQEKVESLLSVGGQYPELGRLMVLLSEQWPLVLDELLSRIGSQRLALAEVAGTSAELGPMTGIWLGAGDPHENGRSAAVLYFGDHTVVYKPRSLDGEAGWARMLSKAMSHGLGMDTYLPRLARFDGWGLMEYIPAIDCGDLTAVRRCYERYGGLLAMAHALGTCDLHHENIIVRGECPVVIDAETLFRARLGLSQAGAGRLEAERTLLLDEIDSRESVLELGILPLTIRVPIPGKEGNATAEYEMGAFSLFGRQPLMAAVVAGRGCDNMHMRPVQMVAAAYPNLPSLDGELMAPEGFIPEIICGFRRVHEYLRASKDEFLRPGGLLDEMSGSSIRLLARPTMDYASILTRSLAPQVLKSAEDRADLVLADLRLLGALRFDNLDDLTELELRSLLNGDIPRFELRGDALIGGAGAGLLRAPVECARSRWMAMDETDEWLQASTIRMGLRRMGGELAASAPRGLESPEIERHALRIVELLVEAGRDMRGPGWAYSSYAPGLGATMVHGDLESMYEGAAGTAITIAEAARLTGHAPWRDAAVAVFEHLRDGGTPASAARGGGMARGLGGLLYSMTRVAVATGDESLLDASVRTAVQYAPRLAVDDGPDEVLSGRAGLLLALLALNRQVPTPALRDAMDLAALRLIERAVVDERGASWPLGADGITLTQVSHGSAGVAMALARWATVSGSDKAAELARAGIDFDDCFWDSEERGWLDLRIAGKGGPRTTWSWCNGRSGALLARLVVAEQLGGNFDQGLVRLALRAPESDVLVAASPGLCCGSAGAFDALLTIRGHQLAPDVPMVDSLIKTILATTPASHYSVQTASLLVGCAGLAFALLRAARPNEVHSLLWLG